MKYSLRPVRRVNLHPASWGFLLRSHCGSILWRCVQGESLAGLMKQSVVTDTHVVTTKEHSQSSQERRVSRPHDASYENVGKQTTVHSFVF